MRKQAGIFIVLLSFLSACGMPVVSKPIDQVPGAQIPSPTLVLLTPSPKPTSTPNERTGSALLQGQPACQTAPDTAQPGSIVNISIFNMPANQQVSIRIRSQVASTATTDDNGYANTDIAIPADISMGLQLVSVTAQGTEATSECVIRIWTELSPTPTSSSEQLSITATHEALLVKMDPYCIYTPVSVIRLSPDGEWAAVFCSFDTIEFVRLDETKKREVAADTLINPYADYFINVEHWSSDGQYAYVRLDPHTDGYWEPFHEGIVLYRLDLQTGKIDETLPLKKDDWAFYSFSFSPDGQKLAYIVTDRSPVVLNLLDLQTGAEQSFGFDEKYNTGGGFVWSPDGQRLVFSVTEFDTNTTEYVGTSILLWDGETAEVTELVKDHPGLMQAVEWTEAAKLILELETVVAGELKVQNYELDLTNNSLTEVSP